MEDKLLLIQDTFNEIYEFDNIVKAAEGHIIAVLNGEKLYELCDKEESGDINILELKYIRTKLTFSHKKTINIEFGLYEKEGILPKYEFISVFDENGIFKKDNIIKNY